MKEQEQKGFTCIFCKKIKKELKKPNGCCDECDKEIRGRKK